jgi:hypothetical protein
MLTNMHTPPAEGNFCDKHENAIKPVTVGHYNRHMGYADKSDRMSNSYSISCQTWKWINKLSHQDFRLNLVCNMPEHGARGRPHPQQPTGRPPAPSSTISRLEEANRHHWPTCSANRMNCVSSACGKRRSILTKCKKCDVGLCILRCFKDYHTKVRLKLDDARVGGLYIYIYIYTHTYTHKADNNKKGTHIEFYKNNYLGSCMCLY